MAIINSVYYHDEVWYSYLYVAAVKCRWRVSLFTAIPNDKMRLYNNMVNATRSWSLSFVQHKEHHAAELLSSSANICLHQILMISTLFTDYLEHLLNRLVHDCGNNTAHVVLIQLNTAVEDLFKLDLLSNKYPSLFSMPNIKLRLLALAPHVHDYARWFTKRRFSIDVWYPVFPLDLPLTTESKSLKFTIQGKFSGKRRNYDSLASQIQRKYKVLQQRNITFLVIGTGNDNLQHPLRQSSAVRWLIQKKPTPAASYYKLIHRTAGILPLFGSNDYYINKISSSISCSILTTTPLLSTARILNTYRYIPTKAVWLQRENESEVDALLRISSEHSSTMKFQHALREKRKILKKLASDMYTKNERVLRNLEKWLNNAYDNKMTSRTVKINLLSTARNLR
ncbi:unnamed protein product [Rotaria sp. Silwood2]|nr:unnamed protein product [Rotaria sp. Silwood2]CAF2824837.1 unnamed protein product [Rotaria sp. Silwood2]